METSSEDSGPKTIREALAAGQRSRMKASVAGCCEQRRWRAMKTLALGGKRASSWCRTRRCPVHQLQPGAMA